MSDERQWLHHPETGGHFHCPVEAVPGWMELGWVPGDPPQESNPAVAELLAWRAAQAAEQEQAAKPTKSTKPGAPAAGDKKE